jgi:phospholipid/cholesterol/gamma-HCH transport system substrate-binding protein
MDTNINYTLVGAFVISIVAAIVIAIIWLSSGLSIISNSNYLIYSQESVSGLSIDAPVEYNGVSVGSVKSIELDRDNLHLVRVLLSIQSSTPISKGTTATLTSRGVTGVVFVALKDLGKDPRPLEAEGHQPYPVIPTAPSIFMRLDTALSKVSKNLETVADSIHSLLDKENLKSFKEILTHIDEVTGTLANNSEKMTSILVNTNRASKQLSPLLEYSTASMKTLSVQTLPITYQLLSNLNDMTRTLKEVTIQLKQNPSMLIRGTAPAPLGPGEKR